MVVIDHEMPGGLFWFRQDCVHFTLRTEDGIQIDHDLDDLVPRLPLREVVQDLSTVQSIQPREHVLDHADYTVPTRQHELCHIIKFKDLSVLNELDHDLWELII